MVWPFSKERVDQKPTEISPETRDLVCRNQRLAEKVNALGIETRAVAAEAARVRESNHFGAALTASMRAKEVWT